VACFIKRIPEMILIMAWTNIPDWSTLKVWAVPVVSYQVNVEKSSMTAKNIKLPTTAMTPLARNQYDQNLRHFEFLFTFA